MQEPVQPPAAAASLPAPPPRRPIVIVVFGLFAAVIVWAVAKVLAPFVTAIILGAIVSTFTFPLYRRVRARVGGRAPLAAGIMLLVVTLTVILPAFLLIILLIGQAAQLVEILQKTDYQALLARLEISARLAALQSRFPWIDMSKFEPQGAIFGVVQQIPGFVAAKGGAFLAGFATLLVQFILMLLATYYFYVDGPALVRELKFLSPLPDEYEQAIIDRFRGVVNATFRGQILTAIAQGVVTALGLAIAGIPGAFFWGAIAAVFALIPMVGAAAVWIPASIYLFLASTYGDVPLWQPIFLVAWGAIPVSLVDNVIRPWAMKSGANMPAVLLLFSILGGMQAFGFVGLILGPLVFALLLVVVQIYKDFFGKSLSGTPTPPVLPPEQPAE